MTWTQVYSSNILYTDKTTIIPHPFTNPMIIVRASSVGASLSWHRAGFLYPRYSIPEVGAVEGMGRIVYLKAKILKFEPLNLPFYLDFRFLGYIPDCFLTIWETDEPPTNQQIQESLDRIEQKIDSPPTRNLRLDFFE